MAIASTGADRYVGYGSIDNSSRDQYQMITIDKKDAEDNAEDNAGFTIIQYNPDMHDVTAVLLEKCRKFVLRPYNIFLCAIGWKRFKIAEYTTSNRYKLCRVVCSFANIWPLLLMILLLASCATQILLCFTRDTIPFDPPDNNTYFINCSSHLVSSFIIPDILLVGTYIYGLIIFCILQPDELSVMTQKVFCSIEEKKSKQLALSMLFLLILGIAWIIYSLGVSILRVFAHNLDKNIDLEFLPFKLEPGVIKGFLLIISQFGFIVFDISYASVVINYAMQYWTTVDETITEINVTRKSLLKLNGHLSRATSTIMFIFLYSSISSLYNLHQLSPYDDDLLIIGVTGFLSTIQWTFWLFVPLIQAARVTYFGKQLQNMALEIRSRPFHYRDTPQIDLDSLVTYCCNVEMKAKLVNIPISPQLFVSGVFLLGFTFLMVLKFDNYAWIPWF